MDKRYLLIIIIVIVCGVNLFFISNSSDMIGSASVNYQNFTFSMPWDFSTVESNNEHITIYASNFGYVSLSYSNGNYNSLINQLNSDDHSKILSNGTVNVNNISIYSIYYRTSDDNNHSSFFFEKFGQYFKIEMWHFDYDNRNKTIDILSYIVNSLRPNKYNK